MEEQKRALKLLTVKNENQRLHRELEYAKQRLSGTLAGLEKYKPTRQTGYYIAVMFENGIPVDSKIFDPDDEKYEDGDYPPWDVIMPIPNPDDLEKFTGF